MDTTSSFRCTASGCPTIRVGRGRISCVGGSLPFLAERQNLLNVDSWPTCPEAELRQCEAAKSKLEYTPVSIDGRQALAIANGFGEKARKSNYTLWACSILPEHTHLVIARHTYKVEQIANLLKGAATSRIIEEGCHPLAQHAESRKRPPRMWAAHEWKVYLDSEEALEDAIRYVEDNPEKEGKPKQDWSFVTPFTGIPQGGWTTYH